MDKLREILWPIIASGGLGAAIDFLIGEHWRKRIKDLMLGWWIKFEDINWHNFSKVEALTAARIIDLIFGRCMFSLRRLLITGLVCVGISMIWLFLRYIFDDPLNIFVISSSEAPSVPFSKYEWMEIRFLNFIISGLNLILSLLAFVISISVTRYLCTLTIRICGTTSVANFAMFMAVISVTYLLMVTMPVLTRPVRIHFSIAAAFLIKNIGQNNYIQLAIIDISNLLAHVIRDWQSVKLYPNALLEIYSRDCHCIREKFLELNLSYFAWLFRAILIILFSATVLVGYTIARPLSIVWVRIIESDKPAFTLVFSALAALATTISEIVRHL